METKMIKPMLASDVEFDKLSFPLIAQPKIDGVRGLNINGTFTGRSLKTFKNIYTTKLFSNKLLIGLDGELAAGPETSSDLCRVTSSALSTIKGEPYLLWWLFDYMTPGLEGTPYEQRYELLKDRIAAIQSEAPQLGKHLRIMPMAIVDSEPELLALVEVHLVLGYEGTCTRKSSGLHKSGRSTAKEAGLGRIKQFLDFEFVITRYEEGEHNANEAQINALGATFRTSHKENKIPNGMIGTLFGNSLVVVKDGNRVIINEGDEVEVSAGRLSHAERRHYFNNPHELLGRIGKGQFFPKGMKDKLRFATFQSFRDPVDISK